LKKENTLTIYIDGASRGNPGDSGVGIVMKIDDIVVKELSQYIGKTTNNVAEYKALILALEEASKLEPESIKIYSDSELLVNHLTGEYRVKSKHLKSLFDEVAELSKKFDQIDIEKINRDKNKEADKLSKKAITKSKAIFPKKFP